MAQKSKQSSSTARKTAAKKSGPTKKSAAKKTTAAKKTAAPKTTPTPAAPVASSAPAVRRFEHLAEAAAAATALMRKSASTGSKRGPVSTPGIVAVVDALKMAKTTPTKLTGLTAAELPKLAAGQKPKTKKDVERFDSARAALRAFSSDQLGRATTKNKLRGAKLYAIVAVIQSEALLTDKPTVAAARQRRTELSR